MLFANMWQRMSLDTDKMIVTQCGELYRDFSKNPIAIKYIRWAEEYCPERLQAEADKGTILRHIEIRVDECVKEKWKIWRKMRDTDSEYLLAIENCDTEKIWKLENLFEMQAEEIAVKTCLLV